MPLENHCHHAAASVVGFVSLFLGVVDVRCLHVWSLTMGQPVVSAHIKARDPETALVQAHQICRRMGIDHATIQASSFSHHFRCPCQPASVGRESSSIVETRPPGSGCVYGTGIAVVDDGACLPPTFESTCPRIARFPLSGRPVRLSRLDWFRTMCNHHVALDRKRACLERP